MNEIATALLLGLSFGNLWLCVLLVFSLETANRSTCAGYLLGRALAILVLSMGVAAVGRAVDLDNGLLNILSGAFVILFCLYLTATRILGWALPWQKKRMPDGLACMDGCETCPAGAHEALKSICRDCPDNKVCEAEEPEVEGLTRQARALRGRSGALEGKGGFTAGLGLGAVRGAAFCSKLAVLVPMLFYTPLARAFVLALVFTIASSIYPLLGFALGKTVMRLVPYKRWLFAGSTVLLAALGVSFVLKGFGMTALVF